MNIIQQYLDQNEITRYKVSKISSVSQPTLKAAVDSKNGIDGLTGKVIKAIAVALDKTPGIVLDELLQLENKQWERINNLTDFLDPEICNDFRNTINLTPIFMHDERYRSNFNLYCAIMDRVDDSIKYLNEHSESPKTESDFLVFIMYACMVLDAINELQRNLKFENKYANSDNNDAYLYFKEICINQLKLSADDCPTDEQFFRYFRSLSMAHPFETNRIAFLKKNKEIQYSPWVIANDRVSGIPSVGICIYSSKSDNTKILKFPFGTLKDFIQSRFELMKLATDSLNKIVNQQLTIWKSEKIPTNLSSLDTLKAIRTMLIKRYEETYPIDDLISCMTIKLSNAKNEDILKDYREVIVSNIPKIRTAVENLNYEKMYELIDSIYGIRPEIMHEQAHYQLEKIYTYLPHGDHAWGIEQADAFSKEFASKWVTIQAHSMSDDEIIILTHIACYYEAMDQLKLN